MSSAVIFHFFPKIYNDSKVQYLEISGETFILLGRNMNFLKFLKLEIFCSLNYIRSD